MKRIERDGKIEYIVGLFEFKKLEHYLGKTADGLKIDGEKVFLLGYKNEGGISPLELPENYPSYPDNKPVRIARISWRRISFDVLSKEDRAGVKIEKLAVYDWYQAQLKSLLEAMVYFSTL